MMNNVKFSFFNVLLISLSLIFFTQCAKDDDDSFQASGQVNFKITDAPIDNAEVKGAFVTVTDIKVDGQSLELNNKQTIDILAYQ